MPSRSLRLAACAVLPAACLVCLLPRTRACSACDDDVIAGLLTAVDRVDAVDVGGRPFARVEARVNTATASNQDATSLAVCPDGTIAVAWQSRRQEDGRDGVYVQRFGASAQRIGVERRLGAGPPAHRAEPTVTAGAGALWGVWHEFDPARGWRAFLRPLDGGEPRPVDARATGDQLGAVAAGGAGGVFVAWIGQRDGEGRRTRLRAFDRSGAPLADAVAADSGTDAAPTDAGTVALDVLADGGCVLAWSAAGRVRVRTFAADGTPRAPARPATRATANGIDPAVAAAPDGGFAVAWLDGGAGRADRDVVCRRFAPDGTPLSGPVIVSGNDPLRRTGVQIAVAGDGRICVAWNSSLSLRNESRIEARILARDGSPGEWLPVGSPAVRRQELPAAGGRRCLAWTPDGGLAFAWSGDAGLGDGSAAHLTLLHPQAAHRRPVLADFPAADVDRIRAALAQERRAPRARPAHSTFASEAVHPHDPPVRDPKMPFPSGPIGTDLPGPSPDDGFAGIPYTGSTPPDPHLAAGPAHVVAMTNGAIGWWTKDGVRQFLAPFVGAGGFWTGVGARGHAFDPEVLWDPSAGRFWAVLVERDSSRSLFLLAVSDDGDPNGTWHKYRLDVTPAAGQGIDWPNLAVDAGAVYLTADFIDPRGQKAFLVHAMDKAPLLAGQAPAAPRQMVQQTQDLRSFGLAHNWSAAPAQYMLEHQNGATNNTSIVLHAITDPLTSLQTMSFSIPVPGYDRPTFAPQGTSPFVVNLAGIGARFLSCSFRNGSVWAAHNHGSPARARWYEIATNGWPMSGLLPSLVQSGEAPVPPGVEAFHNSIAADAQGNALMVYARSSPTEFVSIERCFRLRGDPPGTMRPPVRIQDSVAPWPFFQRWGDYSQVCPDPVTDELWYTHEYVPLAGSWQTWIGSKRPNEWLEADPAALSAGSGGTVRFRLDEPGHAGRGYVLLATASGSQPGFLLPPLGVRVPINADWLTSAVFLAMAGPPFGGFYGTLDAQGRAAAAVALPPVPGAQGMVLDFAFVSSPAQWDFASNDVAVRIGP